MSYAKTRFAETTKILLINNTPPDINVHRRAVKLKERLCKNRLFKVDFKSKSDNIFSDFTIIFKKIMLNKYSIVHVFEPFSPTFPFLFILLKFRTKKLIYDSGDIHYLSVLTANSPLKLKVSVRFNEFLAYKCSDIVIVRGFSAKDVVPKYYNLPRESIRWIPDGVDLIKFDEADGQGIREKHRLGSAFIIGYASGIRFLRIKENLMPRGWELLYVMDKMIKSGRDDFRLLIVGTGPALPVFIKLVKDNGYDKYVTFAGFVDNSEYAKYLRAMDVGFYESINTPLYQVMMPTKLVEYMAASLPILAGNIGEAKRTYNSNGILFAPLEADFRNLDMYIDEIYHAVSFMYDNREILRNMGKRSRQIAEKFYSWDIIASEYEKIIDENH